MDDREKIQSFGDMVEATERISRPWRLFCLWLLIALVVTNLIWGFVHWKHIKYAYMTPTEFSQVQDFEGQTQSQQQSEGATNGK